LEGELQAKDIAIATLKVSWFQFLCTLNPSCTTFKFDLKPAKKCFKCKFLMEHWINMYTYVLSMSKYWTSNDLNHLNTKLLKDRSSNDSTSMLKQLKQFQSVSENQTIWLKDTFSWSGLRFTKLYYHSFL
jgi:hypothetical protein